MDMDSIITDWKQNAEQHDARNFKFLRSLKMEDDRAVDRAARRLHKEAFSIIDGLRCGNCCKTVSPTFTTEDIARIAAHLGMDAAAFTTEYLTESEDRGLMEPKSLPCPFLAADNRCKIYELRPTSCAEYEADFWFDAASSTKRRKLWMGMVIERELDSFPVQRRRQGRVRQLQAPEENGPHPQPRGRCTR